MKIQKYKNTKNKIKNFESKRKFFVPLKISLIFFSSSFGKFFSPKFFSLQNSSKQTQTRAEWSLSEEEQDPWKIWLRLIGKTKETRAEWSLSEKEQDPWKILSRLFFLKTKTQAEWSLSEEEQDPWKVLLSLFEKRKLEPNGNCPKKIKKRNKIPEKFYRD